MSGYYDEDYGFTDVDFDEGEPLDAIDEDTVYCARCHSAWDLCETYTIDHRCVCVDCAQDAIDALIAERDRLGAALEGREVPS